MSPLKHLWARLRAVPSHPFARAMATVGGTSIAAVSLWTLIARNLVTYGPSEGPSMYPTIPSQRSYNILSRRHKHGRNIQVGDIIVYQSPMFQGRRACKRVIGMPGDYVVRDPSLSPTVGDARVVGLYEGAADGVREEPVMVQVPEGHVWVAGDNLSYSRDSRFHGPVPMALIQGKTLYVGDGWFNWTSLRKPQLQPALLAVETTARDPDEKIGMEVSHAG
ncbi:hypothetical protein A1O7_08888 [Cladophialophora yegresii CBS 114405]|uniref:Mitochondrial inner membrane protease subunit n=1 Tax=Cladophialophora yegresii CBS 114405 TaxID=1182544 RepID=W9VJU9_9EURO|nr:uncharacterized protein A1O7_08888 [Cladophialophora yegresii CBS 114405]EXJ55957.1 hypothetical protein A1O7_08888 [Cladophialophora yegresii CBS 114405]